MLYIEQPVGTGYSQGTPNIGNEDDLAAQFVGFLQQFLEVFPELKGKKTYLAGESVSLRFPFSHVVDTEYHLVVMQYAGTYIPCGSWLRVSGSYAEFL